IETHVDIVGLQDQALKNAQDRLAILGKTLQPQDREAANDFADQAIHTLETAIAPYGYFNPTISKKLHCSPKNCQITFKVHLPKRVRYQSIEIQILGNQLSNTLKKELLQKFLIKPDEFLDTPRYEAAKNELFQNIYNQGFVKA